MLHYTPGSPFTTQIVCPQCDQLHTVESHARFRSPYVVTLDGVWATYRCSGKLYEVGFLYSQLCKQSSAVIIPHHVHRVERYDENHTLSRGMFTQLDDAQMAVEGATCLTCGKHAKRFFLTIPGIQDDQWITMWS
jgi:hypothetical protein